MVLKSAVRTSCLKNLKTELQASLPQSNGVMSMAVSHTVTSSQLRGQTTLPIEECEIMAHHYYEIHGTYSLSVGESNDVTFKNRTLPNYYKADGITISTTNVNANRRGLDEYWGFRWLKLLKKPCI